MDLLHVSQDEKLKKAILILKNEFAPTKLLLFGSRANGSAKEDSDYDFVVVTSEMHLPRAERIRKVKTALREINVVADLFIYTQKLYSDWENEFSSIPETAKNTGLELPL